MKSLLLKIFIQLVVIVWFTSVSHAQDIHFSQYYNSPLNLNPALAGLFSEDVRFIANSRHQWGAVPVNYLTFSGSYDQKVSSKRIKNGLITKGAIFNFDHAGDSRMSLFQMAGNFSYIKRLGELNLISIGTQIGFRSRFFEDRNLTFDSQFNGEAFNPKAATGENFRNRSSFILDFGIGINYRMQLREKRSHLDFGVSMYHPTEPKVNFLSDLAANLPSRRAFYIMTSFKATKKLDVLTHLGAQNQGANNEFFVSNLYRFYLVQQKYVQKSIQIGASYRFSEREDAVYPSIEFITDRYHLGLSYDITISKFKIANGGRGGPEVSFQYLISTVKAVKSAKACPIF
jgi:type IX secretion system PorP/SprF family membrane protein